MIQKNKMYTYPLYIHLLNIKTRITVRKKNVCKLYEKQDFQA